ncbi:MAG: CHRD domain-containing protein [Candidatus Kapaibacterium sp.]
MIHPTSYRKKTALTLLALALLGIGTAGAIAQESFPASHVAVLRGENEIPPITPITTAGVGVGIFRYDAGSKSLEYRLTVTLPSGDTITGAHFHLGPEGTQGQVIRGIAFAPGARTATGTWSSITDSVIPSLLSGNVYVNVHTQRNPGGQIRSQVIRIPSLSAEPLEPAQETPPATNSTGTGQAFIWLDLPSRTATYDVKWSNLTGEVTMAHFHRGAPGVAGPVAHAIDLPLMPQPTGETIGSWGNLSDADIADMIAGRFYVNIHTAQYPAGEIRGQVQTYELFSAAISPANEVPPVSGSTASGTGIALIRGGKRLTASFIVEGTTGPIGQAHIHQGRIGVSGPVQIPMTGFITVWAVDSIEISLEQAILLRTTGAYANFHTTAFGNGEARGQLIPASTNLPLPTTGVEYVLPGLGTSGLSARVDGGLLRFTLDPSVAGRDREIILYSIMGQRISSTDVLDNQGTIPAGSLPSGSYVAQLRANGKVIATERIGIAR